MRSRTRKKFIRSSMLACAVIASCSSRPPNAPPPPDAGLINDPVLGVADTGTRCPIPALMDLWQRRTDTPHEDYPMGPGDELTLSVPEIEELQNQHTRISQEGMISLPLIGTVEVGGLDEDRARAVISQRLAKYMKNPRLEMYVERYRSRGVAVAGAVQKPGVYDLASSSDSLNDMIAMAGGLSPSAAQHAVFLPVGITQDLTAVPADRPEVAANLTSTSAVANQQAPEAYKDTLARRASITLPFGRNGAPGCLDMPARPGDVILVPAAGTVTVVGWVKNPGSFPVTPGMTVLGAVTAAGGAEFTWHAEVLRTDQTGSRVVKRFSLSDLENGTETDIPVEAGDVVLLEKSVVGAVPFGLLKIFERFGAGIGLGLPAM
jgi:protein involved in polysaccharide export with SLBB domain